MSALLTMDAVMDAALLVLIAGGGTGGHLYPAMAIGEALAARGVRVHYVGSTAGIEARVLPRSGLDHTLLPSARLRGGGPLVAARGVWGLLRSVGQALTLLRSLRPAVVVGAGGYASGAAVIAAWLLRVPVVVQEQNAVPGLTNKVAGRLASRVFVSFAPAVGSFPTGRAEVAGNPIRRGIREALVDAGGGRGLLVFGGSQGARFLNEQVPALVARLGVPVLHQTGPADVEATRARYAALGVEADVRPYIDDMAAAYASASLAICRAGASTIAELLAVGLPAVLVPFPHAAHDHQAANARVLDEAGAAIMIRQEEWDLDAVARRIRALLADPARLASMGGAARSLAHPDAADRIATAVLALARGEA